MSPVTTGIGWEGALPSTRGKLVSKVCAIYGFSSDDGDLNAQALGWLDDTADEINCALFEFNKAVETGIPLTAATRTAELTALFYRESLAYLVKTSSGVANEPMVYLPWVQFQRWYGDKSQTGEPQFYSTLNSDSDGLVYLWPTPDATTASDFTLTVEYYRRVPHISSVPVETAISVPREIENALVYGAQKRAAIHILGPGDKDVAALEVLEAKAMERLRRVDRAHPDVQKRWILSDFAGRGSKRAGTDFWVRY
jgi:hypothetical protein